jgi:hypothetical protein
VVTCRSLSLSLTVKEKDHRRNIMVVHVPTLPLDCTFATFIWHWERSRAVVLRGARRSTRRSTSAAQPPTYDSPAEVLRARTDLLEASFTSETVASGKRKRQRPPPASAAELLSSQSLPLGNYYCSFVVSRQPELLALLLETSLSRAEPPCFSPPEGTVRQERALWFFIGRNESDAPLPGRPPHTDAVEHDGTYHRQLAGRKEWTYVACLHHTPSCPFARRLLAH